MTAVAGPAPRETTLPRGLVVLCGADVRSADRGRTLFGGSPPRLLYLKPPAARLLRDGREIGRAHV